MVLSMDEIRSVCYFEIILTSPCALRCKYRSALDSSNDIYCNKHHAYPAKDEILPGENMNVRQQAAPEKLYWRALPNNESGVRISTTQGIA